MGRRGILAVVLSSLIAISATFIVGVQPAAAASSCTSSYAPVTDYNGRVFNYRYYCSTYVNQAMYWNVHANDTKYLDDSGYMWQASSVWVICQFVGRQNPTIQGHNNTRWLYTWGDEARSESGPYGNGWGFLPATAMSQGGENAPVPGVPTCSSSVIPAANAVTTPFPSPQGGWFAKKDGVTTDPINVVVYYPNGGALSIVTQALEASGWGPNSCINLSVHLNTDGTWRSPNRVGTDNQGGFGCGTPGYERNHARFWTTESADGVYVWIAASIENYCPTTLHCIAPNGFNRGRDDLVTRLLEGLPSVNNHSYILSSVNPAPYSSSSLGGISYSNYVPVVRIV